MNIKSIFSIGAWKQRLLNYRRVIEISKKPEQEEFIKTTKITGAGIALVGIIGFVIFLIYQLFVSGIFV